MLNNKELSLELSDFYRDNCMHCADSYGASCAIEPEIVKCLRSFFIVGVYRGRMFTTKNSYTPCDWRHYVFEQPKTVAEVCDELRRNA